MGNLGSVRRKLDRIGAESVVSSKQGELEGCSRLILPGVGHFSKAVSNIKTLGLWDFLQHEVLEHKKPILGICLGMQLMAARSEEGDAEGLGWFDAEVVRFSVADTLTHKVPHMGWNSVVLEKPSPLFNGVSLEQGFYFVHSYHFICNNREDVLNTTVYSYPFTSAVQKENIIGVQYHPEKSHDSGEKLLRNFCE